MSLFNNSCPSVITQKEALSMTSQNIFKAASKDSLPEVNALISLYRALARCRKDLFTEDFSTFVVNSWREFELKIDLRYMSCYKLYHDGKISKEELQYYEDNINIADETIFELTDFSRPQYINIDMLTAVAV